jgi:hypothetical protein
MRYFAAVLMPAAIITGIILAEVAFRVKAWRDKR